MYECLHYIWKHVSVTNYARKSRFYCIPPCIQFYKVSQDINTSNINFFSPLATVFLELGEQNKQSPAGPRVFSLRIRPYEDFRYDAVSVSPEVRERTFWEYK